MTETDFDVVLRQAGAVTPALMIIDSVQTMFCPDLPAAPGTVGQIREVTGRLLRFAKQSGVPVAVVGHMTKDGLIAGPRLMEHMVDVVLNFEGERNLAFRVLRATKNRFGPTNDSGLFAMEDTGLVEVDKPSAALLAGRSEGVPGSVVLAGVEGTRPLLVEIQALVSSTYFGTPRRMAVGFDYNRLTMLMAVLEKRVGLPLGSQDAYVNAVGGIKIVEPAADLAVVLAVASSFRNVPVSWPSTAVTGEVGLTGEVRPVARIGSRIGEALSLGFTKLVIPAGNLKELKPCPGGIDIIGVRTVVEAMEAVLR